MKKGQHALSFGKNPAFKDLISTICSDDQVVLVLGAGVSIESGLPTWSELLDRLGDDIETPFLNDLIRAEETDPSRRAALTLAALHEGNGIPGNARIVKTLYHPLPQASGNLLLSLVSLIKKLGSRVKVITLNYDDCLEYALVENGGYRERDVHPYGLEERGHWEECMSGVAILHIHGFLPRDLNKSNPSHGRWPEKVPVILEEGEYIQYGSVVQELIRKTAERAHLIFVGTSLTDANITHPLSDRYTYRADNSQAPPKSAFALLVPSEVGAAKVYHSMDEAARRRTNIARLADIYFTERSDHIARTYRIATIRLNSYSQVTQAIRECALAIDDTEQYFDNSDDSSIRYGKRYRRIMQDIYSRLAVSPGGIAPGGKESQLLSDELEKELSSKVLPLIENELLEDLMEEYTNSDGDPSRRGPDEDDARKNFEKERFGLYLWLRSALTARGNDEFEVFIAGASSYSRRDGATMSQRSTVSRNSIYASARAVASGTMELFSRRYQGGGLWRPGEALDRPWNMHWAVPISVSEPDLKGDGARGRVCVGAIVLQSSKYDQAPDEEFDSRNHSLLSLIYQNPTCNQRLSECLAECGTRLVTNFSTL